MFTSAMTVPVLRGVRFTNDRAVNMGKRPEPSSWFRVVARLRAGGFPTLMMCLLAGCSSDLGGEPMPRSPETPTSGSPMQSSPDAGLPVSPATDAQRIPSPTRLGCTPLPQPSKPGATSVQPDDMACTHGDAVYDCPESFAREAARLRCARATKHGWWSARRTWCCPGAS
jgi:hypothetical protein